MAKSDQFALVVPLDASGVEDRSAASALKVLLQDASGPVDSQVVKLSKDGTAEATFEFAEQPQALTVVVGPADVADADLAGMQTLTTRVPLRVWSSSRLVLDSIIIPPYHWHWWLRWCRHFTIRGVVTCADGSPVPGAKVCAQDVDAWWWWTSRDEVACATTDVNGAFEIDFTWCCGFWPWWWFARRNWYVDPYIAERIHSVLEREPRIGPIPGPDPTPDFKVFDVLLARGDHAAPLAGPITDPTDIEALRPQLLERLPIRPELDALRIWPWRPWRPWTDCTPDIAFRVTQDCGQGEVVILEESFSETRWNIPTDLSVHLVAGNNACCIRRPPECGETECVALTKVCDTLLDEVGGNLGTGGPDGYALPGDRPFAGTVPIHGVCADWVDYYEFEVSDGSGYVPLAPDAAGGFTLVYYQAALPHFVAVSFPVQNIGGHRVIETVAHWEAANGGAKAWVSDTTVLVNWLTTKASATGTGPIALFADGTYDLRLRAYALTAPNTLSDGDIPLQCGEKYENVVRLTIDNRLVGPGSGHPNVAGHQCGGVHVCTTEPDTDFISVKIDGVAQDACAFVDLAQAKVLEIEFLAHDPDDHLQSYSLDAYWGENGYRPLLSLPSATLAAVSADHVGPTYGAALASVPRPSWAGGTIRLTVNVADAFPDPCCYLLDLRAYKRTIDSCDYNYTHQNRSTFTMTVA
jgi:hypothetical protein